MADPTLQMFRPEQVLSTVSKHRYRLVEHASTFHQHVWFGCSESDNRQVVIKTPFRMEDSKQREAVRQLETEMRLLRGPLQQVDGVRQLLDQIVLEKAPDKPARLGVFEFLDLDLHKHHLVQRKHLSRAQIKSIARQVLKGLSAMHKRNIVHTDLKPENIVFSLNSQALTSGSSDLLVKMIDFGVASNQDEDRYRLISNPYWRSPESWLGMPWGPPADIWSFGAIVGSLLMEPGAKLFQPMGGLALVPIAERERELVRALWTMIPFTTSLLDRMPRKWSDEISRFSPKLAPTGDPITLSFIGELFEIPPDDWAFVRDVLQVDPIKRPTADDLLRHPWLS